jgi:hypothetical protein
MCDYCKKKSNGINGCIMEVNFPANGHLVGDVVSDVIFFPGMSKSVRGIFTSLT